MQLSRLKIKVVLWDCYKFSSFYVSLKLCIMNSASSYLMGRSLQDQRQSIQSFSYNVLQVFGLVSWFSILKKQNKTTKKANQTHNAKYTVLQNLEFLLVQINRKEKVLAFSAGSNYILCIQANRQRYFI